LNQSQFVSSNLSASKLPQIGVPRPRSNTPLSQCSPVCCHHNRGKEPNHARNVFKTKKQLKDEEDKRKLLQIKINCNFLIIYSDP
jgi:hypothetical protein